MIVFDEEPLEVCWREIYEQPDGLAFHHWLETQQHRHSQPYAPNFERYNQYARAGWFHQFTVRDDGVMVGYSGVYVLPSMHTQCLIATEDTWYMDPAYRKGWNAIKFYRFIEQACAEMGVIEATLTLPVQKGLGALLERLDYKPVSIQYSKHLVRADSPRHQPDVELSNVRPQSAASA